MSAAPGCDAILLIGFGGPEAPGQIRPFLDRVLKGRPVPPARYEEVVRHYEALGGCSPYNDLTRRQAAGLRKALERRGVDVPVVIGFRNTAPYIEDAIRELSEAGRDRVIGFILSAFRCEASWERYQNRVASAREAIGRNAPAVAYPEPWHTRPGFIEAVTDCVRRALGRIDEPDRSRAELIFTAHSIPIAMAAESPYVAQLQEASSLVARELGRERWSVAFQSRSGSPRDPWLEPDVRTALVANSQPKIVMPIGFLCDHVEVLYDLDVDAAETARAAGIRMERASALNDHPGFIDLMARIALERIERGR
jgi:ferrochelatase